MLSVMTACSIVIATVTAGLNCTNAWLDTMKLTPMLNAVDSACCNMLSYSQGSLLISMRIVAIITKVIVTLMGRMRWA